MALSRFTQGTLRGIQSFIDKLNAMVDALNGLDNVRGDDVFISVTRGPNARLVSLNLQKVLERVPKSPQSPATSGGQKLLYVKNDTASDTIIFSSTTSILTYVPFVSLSVVVPWADVANGLLSIRALIRTTANTLGSGTLVLTPAINGSPLTSFNFVVNSANFNNAYTSYDVDINPFHDSVDKINWASRMIATAGGSIGTNSGIIVNEARKGDSFTGADSSDRTLTLTAAAICSGSFFTVDLYNVSVTAVVI